jgi:hypothetical protein
VTKKNIEIPVTEVAEVRHHSSDWCGTGVATDVYQSRPATCHNTDFEILYVIMKDLIRLL